MARPYVIVAGDFVRTGGMDRANYALARHLARRGDETHLVAFRVAPDLAAEANVHIHLARRPFGRGTLGSPFLGSLAAVQSLRVKHRELIANGGNCLVPGAVNWVHCVHGAAAEWRSGRASATTLIAQATERVALAGARLVIANSERTRSDLVKYVGVDDSRIRVVYLGVDSTDFRPRTSAERAAIRAGIGWPAERLKVLFVGAPADPRKGFATVYAAWRRLCRSPDWDADMVVVGGGPRTEALRQRARDDGIGERITFLGFRSDMHHVISACDLVVAASTYDSYGLSVHEALCSAVPAITSSKSGVAEVYPDALADWVQPDPEDDVDLANRIQRWRSSARVTPHALRALSDRLRARDWDVVAKDVVALCEA